MSTNNELKDQNVFKENPSDSEKKPTNLGMDENIAGLLTYVGGLITGIIFLVLEKENKFVRFHAMQSIAVTVTMIVLSIVLSFIPVIGWILGLLLGPVSFVLWVFLMFKAYKGEKFKLPFIGDIAESQVK